MLWFITKPAYDKLQSFFSIVTWERSGEPRAKSMYDKDAVAFSLTNCVFPCAGFLLQHLHATMATWW